MSRSILIMLGLVTLLPIVASLGAQVGEGRDPLLRGNDVKCNPTKHDGNCMECNASCRAIALSTFYYCTEQTPLDDDSGVRTSVFSVFDRANTCGVELVDGLEADGEELEDMCTRYESCHYAECVRGSGGYDVDCRDFCEGVECDAAAALDAEEDEVFDVIDIRQAGGSDAVDTRQKRDLNGGRGLESGSTGSDYRHEKGPTNIVEVPSESVGGIGGGKDVLGGDISRSRIGGGGGGGRSGATRRSRCKSTFRDCKKTCRRDNKKKNGKMNKDKLRGCKRGCRVDFRSCKR